eukprot:TRINITY_DN747_c0_g1_i1.p1 TRINITY_DN747_c0_g1~~TRINITY_DN747_c0_g1_i1.p1  ORF type:complete len:365 (+),score=141.41 TRINITY_DN747_c0_g1_i1:166-1260(+)
MAATFGRSQKPILEFRAGKMQIRGNVVSPDTRKGLIQLVQEDDQLVHFKWIDRANKQVDTDLVLVPDPSCSFKRIKQCTTGRVFLLEWKTTHVRMFFWMQEPSTDKDEEILTKVNSLINPSGQSFATTHVAASPLPSHHRPATTATAPATTSGASTAPASTASTAAVRPATAASSAALTGDLLQNLLSGLGVEDQGSQEEDEVGLEGVMDATRLEEMLRDEEFANRLLEFLPEGRRTRQELQDLIRSPQFAQALRAFGGAIQSGGLGGILPHFGLPPTSGNSITALINALSQNSARSSSTTSTTNTSDSSGASAANTNTNTNTESGTTSTGTGTTEGSDKMDVDEEMPPLIPDKKNNEDPEKKQ